MALTRITKGVIKPNENYDTHNINSTGIVTAIGLDVNGNGDISGNLSVGGVLTYEDVTSIDSVGIITAQSDIHVGAGLSVVGVGSFGTVKVGTGVTFETNGQGTLSGIVTSRGFNVSSSGDNGVTNSFIAGRIKIFDPGSQCQIQFGSGPSYSPHQKYASAMTYRTNAFTLQNTGTTRTALSWVNSDGPVNLWYTKGYAPDYSIKLSTTPIGVTVGSGVTIETNGQANFAGITTVSGTDLVVKPPTVSTSRIKLGYAEQMKITVTSSNQNVIQSTAAYLQIASNNVNISRQDMNLHMARFLAGQQCKLTYNYIDRIATSGVGATVYGQFDTTNMTVAGVSTFSDNIRVADNKTYGFASDTNTFIGRPAADTIGFTFGGTEMVRMGYVPSIAGGGIGINRTSIGARLHIQHDGSGALRHMVKLANNGSGQGTGAQINMGASTADEQYSASIAGFYDNPGTAFIVKTAGTYGNQSTVAERLRITPTGSVGIGTNSIESFGGGHVTLEVAGSTTSHGGVFKTATSDSAGTGSSGTEMIMFTDNTKGAINVVSSDPLTFSTANTERLRIDSSGRVLIGTTTEGFAEADDLTINSADHGGISIRTPNNKEGNIAFSDSTSGTGEYSGLIRYRHLVNDLGLWTNSNLRLLIDSSGRVLIGTTTEGYSGGDDLTISTSGDTGMTIRSGTSSQGILAFSDGTSGADEYRGYVQYLHNGDALLFGTDATERLRITSGGQVRIGNPNNLALWGQNNRLQVAGTDWNTSGITIACMSNSGSANLILGNSRASTPGGSGGALVQDSRLGYISFVGDDGTDMNTVGAAIVAELDSNASSNSMPGRLRFYTGGNSQERLRITSGGVVQIGGQTSNSADIDTSNTKLTIKQSANNKEDGIYIERSGERRGHYIYVGGAHGQSDALCVTTNQLGGDTDLLAIDRGGNVIIKPGKVGIGYESPVTALDVRGSSDASITIGLDNGTKYGNFSCDNSATYLYAYNGNDIIFSTHSGNSYNRKVTIKNDGKFCIGGTTSVGTLLHIENGSGDAYIRCRASVNKALLFNNSDGSAHGFIGSGGTNGGGSSDLAVQSNVGNIVLHTANGGVRKPNNPCFQAVRTSGGTISSGNYIVYNAVDVNIGSHYNNSNGVFTAPVAGIYLFHIASIAHNNASTVFRFYLRINNGNIGSGNDAHLRLDMNNDDNDYGPNASFTYYRYMNVNDTARVYFSSDGGNAAYSGADYLKFGGHLVG